MPICFSLTPKGETKPESFASIDHKMCAYFEVPTDPKHWFHDWYNILGWPFALGKSYPEVLTWLGDYEDEILIKILDWINENYTVDSWREAR